MAGNTNAVQVRIRAIDATMAGGARKHDLRIGRQPDFIDRARTHLNRVLVRSLTGVQLQRECEARRSQRETKRAMKSNVAVCVWGIITFGHGAQPIFNALSPEQQNAAYREVAEAVAARIGTTLTGLVIHRDEAADHAHFQCPAFTLDGRPVSKVANRAALRDFQTIAAEIMARHCPGIERGTPRFKRIEAGESYADTVHKSAAEMRERLPADIAAREAELAALRTQVEAAQERQRVNEDRAAKAWSKAQADDERAAKTRRNAETYERRASEARQVVAALEQRVMDARKIIVTAKETEQAAQASVVKLREEQALAEQATQNARREEKAARERTQESLQEASRATEEVSRLQALLGPLRASLAFYDGFLARQADRFRPLAHHWQAALDAVRTVLTPSQMPSPQEIVGRSIALVLAHPVSAGFAGRQWSPDPRENWLTLETMDSEAGERVRDALDTPPDEWPGLHFFGEPIFREEFGEVRAGDDGITWQPERIAERPFRRHRAFVSEIIQVLATAMRAADETPEPMPPEAEAAAAVPEPLRQALRDTKPSGPGGR